MVGLKVDFLWYPIGSADFFHSFFSTICYNLEEKKWGSKYPHVMNRLYQGKLDYHDTDETLKEIFLIREKFKSFSPQNIIWDIEDLSRQPPWGDRISKDITDLSNYFITCDGKDLFEEIIKALHESKAEEQDIIIE